VTLAAGISDLATPILFVLLALVWIRASRHFGARLRDDSMPRPDYSTAPWPAEFVAVVLAVYVGVFAIVVVAARALGLGIEGVVAMTVSAAVDGLACVFAVTFARRAFGVSNDAFGLARQLDGRTAVFALSAYATFVPLMMAAKLLSDWLTQLRGREPQPQDVLKILGVAHGTGTFALLATLSVVVIPIAEEILFRGILFATLRPRLGRVTAIVASSAAFALLHDTPVMFPVFVVGVCLAIVFDRTKSIAASGLVHVVHNGIQVLSLALLRR
jgi:membrane protease YdiL (CAAX protease family)